MDKLEQLRIFLRVAHAQSFTVAAEQLRLPRASVSLAVQQLEKHFGARLLACITRSVQLTQEGQSLLVGAQRLTDDWQEMQHQFLGDATAISGRLVVSVPSRVARRLLIPALPDFLAQHPSVQLELSSSDRSVDLLREGVDCALRVGALPDSSLMSRPLGTWQMVHCASPAYAAQYGLAQEPEELDKHRMVAYASPTTGQIAPWEWLENGICQQRPLPAAVTVNHVESYIACALAGLGLIQVPHFDVAHHLHSGALLSCMPKHPAPSLPVQWVYPHRQQLARRAQVFMRWAETLLAPHLNTHSAA